MDFRMMGIFCEDIREDGIGLYSLTRIYPDTVAVPAFPNVLPKLAFYLRISVAVACTVTPIDVVLTRMGEDDMPITTLDVAIIRRAQEEARSAGLPFGTITTTAVAPEFRVARPGRIEVHATTDAMKILCATLTFEEVGAS